MQVTIPKRDFSSIIKHAAKAVERRNTIPILGNVLLNATANNRLSVKATDLDIEVETSVACEVGKHGSTTVPAIMLQSIVDKLKPDATITLEQEDGKAVLNIKAARSRFKLQTLPVTDFPDLAVKEIITKFELPVADLTNILKRANFCISTEETRYYLNGIFLHHVNGDKDVKLRGVATDGHRLAQIECDAPPGADTFRSGNNPTGVILPRKTINLISLILKDGGIEKVGVQMNGERAIFTLGNLTLASKLIDGSFPDYQRVVPSSNDKIMRVDRAELHSAVDRLSTVSSERGRVAKFAMTPDKLVISITNPDAGSATEEMDVEYSGADLEIGFNSLYMLDILANVEGDQVEMAFADAGSPALVKGVGKPDALFVAMPMRV